MSTPPPPPAEPLIPIVLPAGSPTRSAVLLWGVAIAAIVAALVNFAGLVQFPYNAPVEQVFAFGISVDLVAVAVASAIGAVVSRRGYPLRPRTPITTIALVFAGVALLFWAVGGGVWSIVQLAQGDGRYMDATGGLFFSGALWALAAVFASHGYRRGGDRRNNLFAVVALIVVGALVVYAVVSSVVYGLGLTD